MYVLLVMQMSPERPACLPETCLQKDLSLRKDLFPWGGGGEGQYMVHFRLVANSNWVSNIAMIFKIKVQNARFSHEKCLQKTP